MLMPVPCCHQYRLACCGRINKAQVPPKQLLGYNKCPILVLGCFPPATVAEEITSDILYSVVPQGKALFGLSARSFSEACQFRRKFKMPLDARI